MQDLDLGWLSEFQQAVNKDEEMSFVGEWFDTTFSINFGSSRVAIKIQRGEITEVIENPRIDTRPSFGFSAPTEIWRKFFSKNPPPMFHDFFAMMMRVPDFSLEGDGLVAMQNARALHRTMSIMREVGAKHV